MLRRRGGQVLLVVVAAAASLAAGGCPPPDGETGTLEGTWAGTITYTVGLDAADVIPIVFTDTTTITFSAEGVPDKIGISIKDEQVLELPTAQLLEVGDTATVAVTHNGTTTTLNATVTDITRGDSAFSLSLDLEIVFTGAVDATLTGEHTFTAAVTAEDTLNWDGETTVDLGGEVIDIGLRSTSEGTLTRQP